MRTPSESTSSPETAAATLAERHALMEQVASLGQMAQAGALMASLTHQISQPLTALLLNVQQALVFAEGGSGDDRVPPLLREAESATLRLSEQLRQLRHMFANPGIGHTPAPGDALVSLAAAMMKRHLDDAQIELVLQLGGGPAQLSDKGLEHVLLNLLHNSLHAFRTHAPARRRIDVCTWTVEGQYRMAFTSSLPASAYGEGTQLFELHGGEAPHPWALGLWLARFIVERQLGRIILDPAAADGLCVQVSLPLADAPWPDVPGPA